MIEFIFAVFIGTVTGVLTGAGVGGGTILVLYLSVVAGVQQGAAQGVNLLYFLVSAPVALFFHIRAGRVEIKPAIYAAVCGSIAATFGAWLSGVLDESTLRTAFGVLCIVIGVKELFIRKKNKSL